MNRERAKAEPVSVSPVRMAPSSRVNAPGDRFEVEADRLARRVTGPSLGMPIEVQPAGHHVQRAAESSASIPELNGSLRLGGGEPLPSRVEGHMAGHLGHSFAEVRIHRDDYAARVSRQLNARAFAYDQHLFFGDGAYDPHSGPGQRLIGHELVHTLQQRQISLVQRLPKLREDEIERLNQLSKAVHENPIATHNDALIKGVEQVAARAADETVAFLRDQAVDENQMRQLERIQTKVKILNDKIKVENTGNMTPEQKENYHLRRNNAELIQKRLSQDPLFQKYLVVTTNLDLFLKAMIYTLTPPSANDMPHHTMELQKDQVVLSRSVNRHVISLYSREIYSALDIDPTMLIPLGDESEADHEFEEAPQPTEVPPENDFSKEPENVSVDGQEKTDTTDRPLTEAEQQVVDEFLNIPNSEPQEPLSAEDYDQYLRDMAELLTDMNDLERAEFLADLVSFMATEEKKGEALDAREAAKKLRDLSPADRQALRTNRALHPDQPAAKDVPEEVNLILQSDQERFADDPEIQKMHQDLTAIRSQIRDPKKLAEFDSILDKLGGRKQFNEDMPIFSEMMLLEGLLAGAASQSDEIKEVAVTFTTDMARIRTFLMTEIAWMAASIGASMALGALSGGAGYLAAAAALGNMVWRLEKLMSLIQKLQKVYEVFQTVQNILGKVEAAMAAYDKYAAAYNDMLAKYERLQQQLISVDAPDDIEEQLDAMENALIEQLQAKLSGDSSFGALLETFYIPAETSEEDLLGILFNIPRGVNALQGTMDYYQNGRKDSEFTRLLALKAVEAGSLLYPVVGYLADELGGRLHDVVNDERSIFDRLLENVSLGSSRKRRKRASRDENKQKLDAKKRKEEGDKAQGSPQMEAALRGPYKKAFTHLERTIDKDGGFIAAGSGKHFWTKGWYKSLVRRTVKELPKVPGVGKTVKTQDGKKRPMPRFRLHDWEFKANETSVNLKLNPDEETKEDQGSIPPEAFQNQGIKVPQTDKAEKLKSLAAEHNNGDQIQQVDRLTDDPTPTGTATRLAHDGKIIKSVPAEERGKQKTKENAIHIKWHKPFSAKYPTLSFLYTQTSNRYTVAPLPGGDVTVPPTGLVSERDRLQEQINKQPTYQKELSSAQKKRDIEKAVHDEVQANLEKFMDLDGSKPYQEAKKGEKPFMIIRVWDTEAPGHRDVAITNAGRGGLTQYAQWYAKRPKEALAKAEREVTRFQGKILTADQIKQQRQRIGDLNTQISQGVSTVNIGIHSDYFTDRGDFVKKRTHGGAGLERGYGTKQKFYQDTLNNTAVDLQFVGVGGTLQKETVEMDHVIDLAFYQGHDVYKNLWPLQSSKNVIPNQKVNIHTWQQVTSGTASSGVYEINHARFNDRWFYLKDDTP